MTIRTRLWVSHIISLIVPILMTLVIITIAITGLYLYIARGNYIYVENLNQYNNATQIVTSITFRDFEKYKKLKYAPIIYQLFDPDSTYMRISQGGSPIYLYGNLELISMIPPEVLMSEAPSRVYARENVYYTRVSKEINGSLFSVTIFAINPVGHNTKNVEFFLKAIGVAIILSILLTIYLINLFLTRFAMGHIIKPLRSLTAGAKEVGAGNLNTHVEHKSNDEFMTITNQFNAMIRNLKENEEQRVNLEKSRKELIAGISHDIRTPLTSIRAYVAGLKDNIDGTKERRERYLDVIESKAIAIDAMLEQLFLFSKLDVGVEALNVETVRLHDFLREYVRDNIDFYRSKGLDINLIVYNNATIKADLTVMTRIISNILNNSVKYKVKEMGTCRIILSTSDKDAIITLSDDGPGVPKEKIDRLFEVFYRTDSARQNTNEGSGIGLAITYKYMQLMHGDISASNTYPSGLQIKITIPLLQRNNLENTSASEEKNSPAQ